MQWSAMQCSAVQCSAVQSSKAAERIKYVTEYLLPTLTDKRHQECQESCELSEDKSKGN